jgi:hypothetical protein
MKPITSIERINESITRLLQCRTHKDACFPNVMPIDFVRLRDLQTMLNGIKLTLETFKNLYIE